MGSSQVHLDYKKIGKVYFFSFFHVNFFIIGHPVTALAMCAMPLIVLIFYGVWVGGVIPVNFFFIIGFVLYLQSP